MGVDCGAAVIVGLEIHHEDFWTKRTITPSHVSCPNGHVRKTGNEKFCSECGGRFGRHTTTKLVCNPHFAKIVGDDDPHGRAGEAWNPERVRFLEEQADPSAFGIKGLELVCVDANEDRMDGGPQNVALGFTLSQVRDIAGSCHDRLLETSQSTVAHYFDECRKLAAMLGVDREPKLYLNTGAG